jgi:class 3 adenylate cyclase
MSPSRLPPTTDLLLDLLHLTRLSAVSAEQAAAQLQHRHRHAGLQRRVRAGIEALAAEGLLTASAGDGELRYRPTPGGLAVLRQRGRIATDATVLFTDIVGSTELIARYGEEGAHARRIRHFALLRDAVAGAGGREVKALGDGLMVIFAEAAAATACARAMQSAVAADGDGLGLRIGVHTGEVLQDHDDVHGSTVIIARRLCDSAEAGQIIVSDATRAGTGEQSVQSLGRLALKGLAQPVAAFNLWWSRRPSASLPIVTG